MSNVLAKIGEIKFTSWQDFWTSPTIVGLSQSNPITAVIGGYFAAAYAQQQYETIYEFLQLLDSQVKTINQKYVDKDFPNTPEGKRIIGKVLRDILRDNRKEKLQAMANLTINIQLKSKLSIDEKELYVDILDVLNSLQLSILQKAVIDMRNRQSNKHRGFGWEGLATEYAAKGISKPLVLQSVRTLESNGLVNENNVPLKEAGQTHFVTDFGEQFYDFVSTTLQEGSLYL